MVALGGGGIGDVTLPVILAGPIVIPNTFAGMSPAKLDKVAAFRCVAWYVEIDARLIAVPVQAQLELLWMRDQVDVVDPQNLGFLATRRSGADIAVDEPLLPIVAGGTRSRFLVPAANPGGCRAACLAVRDIASTGAKVTIWGSMES